MALDAPLKPSFNKTLTYLAGRKEMQEPLNQAGAHPDLSRGRPRDEAHAGDRHGGGGGDGRRGAAAQLLQGDERHGPGPVQHGEDQPVHQALGGREFSVTQKENKKRHQNSCQYYDTNDSNATFNFQHNHYTGHYLAGGLQQGGRGAATGRPPSP